MLGSNGTAQTYLQGRSNELRFITAQIGVLVLITRSLHTQSLKDNFENARARNEHMLAVFSPSAL